MRASIPNFLYGTAWKEDQTEAFTMEALRSGFVGIDTANQRKHYFEEGVGRAIYNHLKSTGIKREHLFLQTKFTYVQGQDSRLPYDPHTSFTEQVNQSFESSLKHLRTDYLDSYVLHGPYGYGIHDADYEVWRAMEHLQKKGKTLRLGISNIGIDQLKKIFEFAEIKPAFVQNRCYARTAWNRDVRHFCNENGIIYQGFSLLTANLHELTKPEIQILVGKYRKTIPQIVFRFSQQIGMLPLTGTTDETHMKQDLDISDFTLAPQDIDQIENISF